MEKIATATSEFDVTETDLIFSLNEKDLLFDIKALIKEYYCGTFTLDEQNLKMQFTNGQVFFLTITKQK